MGMRPCDFWALTPGEWRALTAENSALSRADFDALFMQHPDETP
jgi:hypothetical protein